MKIINLPPELLKHIMWHFSDLSSTKNLIATNSVFRNCLNNVEMNIMRFKFENIIGYKNYYQKCFEIMKKKLYEIPEYSEFIAIFIKLLKFGVSKNDYDWTKNLLSIWTEKYSVICGLIINHDFYESKPPSYYSRSDIFGDDYLRVRVENPVEKYYERKLDGDISNLNIFDIACKNNNLKILKLLNNSLNNVLIKIFDEGGSEDCFYYPIKQSIIHNNIEMFNYLSNQCENRWRHISDGYMYDFEFIFLNCILYVPLKEHKKYFDPEYLTLGSTIESLCKELKKMDLTHIEKEFCYNMIDYYYELYPSIN